MKKEKLFGGALMALFVAWVILVQGCAGWPSPKEAGSQSDQPSPIVLSALAKLGHLEGDPRVNTFFIPKKPNMGDLYVIYWREKNVLFYYPAEAGPEVAENPYLVRGHEYEVKESAFRRRGDQDYATSTYLHTYGWALDRLVDAVADGRKYRLEYKPKK